MSLISWKQDEADLLFGKWELKDNTSFSMIFNKKGFSIIDGEENVTLKKKQNILKVIVHHRPKFKFISKDTYIFRIEHLSKKELVLTQNSSKNNFETLWGDTLIFFRVQ